MKAGDAVQTPLGKGVVREMRNGGRVLVDLGGRAVELRARELAPLTAGRGKGGPPSPLRGFGGAGPPGGVEASVSVDTVRGADRDQERMDRVARRGQVLPGRRESVTSDVDLHGLTVEEALRRVDAALNAALLGNQAELRLIHGRSGGRLRAAVHRRLREVPSVRGFRVDPTNEGVTIVRL